MIKCIWPNVLDVIAGQFQYFQLAHVVEAAAINGILEAIVPEINVDKSVHRYIAGHRQQIVIVEVLNL